MVPLTIGCMELCWTAVGLRFGDPLITLHVGHSRITLRFADISVRLRGNGRRVLSQCDQDVSFVTLAGHIPCMQDSLEKQYKLHDPRIFVYQAWRNTRFAIGLRSETYD